MGLETGTYISDFNATNPAHTDSVGAADGHLRWIKAAILASFTGISGAVTATHTQLNSAVAAVVTGTAAIIAALGSAAAPTYGFLGDSNTGMYSPGADQLSLVTGGVQAVKVTADQSVEFTAAVKAGGLVGQLVPIGMPLPWLSDTLPSASYAWLNGQAISRAGNPVLFAMWGTTYGVGNGTTTFNVPDWRDVVPVGKGTMGGLSDRGLIAASGVNANIDTIGSTIGEGVHTLTQAELPAFKPAITITDTGHHHLFGVTQRTDISATGGAQAAQNPTDGSTGGTSSTGNASTGITAALTSNLGSGTAHNVVQPSIVCNWITLLG